MRRFGDTLVPQFQSILSNPGLSPADQAAVTGQSQGALANSFDSLQQAAQNRMARTRNSAGFGELTGRFGTAEGNCSSRTSGTEPAEFFEHRVSTTDVRTARAFRFVWCGFKFIGAHAGNSRGTVECAIQCVEERERISIYTGFWSGFHAGRPAGRVVLDFHL